MSEEHVNPQEALRALPQNFLDCRDFGHAWHRQQQGPARGEPGIILRVLRCGSCTSTRDDYLTQQGVRARAGRIRYVEGYLLKQTGRIERTTVRAIALRAAARAMRRQRRAS